VQVDVTKNGAADQNEHPSGSHGKHAMRVELERLALLSISALKAKYIELYGDEPRCRGRQSLLRRLAWRVQCLELGDISDRARRHALEIAADADIKVRVPAGFQASAASGGQRRRGRPGRDPRLPPPGTILSRHYHGQLLSITVLENGFEHDGQVFRSLSAIAEQVTGTRWNGFLFFGLKGTVRG
jgi:hypothetical protein